MLLTYWIFITKNLSIKKKQKILTTYSKSIQISKWDKNKESIFYLQTSTRAFFVSNGATWAGWHLKTIPVVANSLCAFRQSEQTSRKFRVNIIGDFQKNSWGCSWNGEMAPFLKNRHFRKRGRRHQSLFDMILKDFRISNMIVSIEITRWRWRQQSFDSYRECCFK